MKKIFSLIKHDLKNAIVSQTLLFSILIFGITASFFTVKMMLGVVQFQINAAKHLNTLHSFTVDFDGRFTPEDYGRIDSIMTSGAELPNVLLMKTSKTEPMLIGFFGSNDNRWYVHDEGDELSPEDELSATKNIVISPGLYNRPDFEYKNYPLIIGKQSFNIIGVGIIPKNDLFFTGGLYQKYYPSDENLNDDEEVVDYIKVKQQYQTILMPFSTFCAQGYQVDLVTFMYQYNSSANFGRFTDLLRNTFPEADLYLPTMPEDYYSSDMQKQLTQALLLVFAALTNIAALFVYWLSINKNVHGVYMLCGSTRAKIIMLILLEWGILIFLSFSFSFAIEKLTAPVFIWLGVTFDFSTWHTFIMLVGGYVMTVLFILPQIHRNANLIRSR